jgi:hypothetical protein
MIAPIPQTDVMAIWSTIPEVEQTICYRVANGSLNKEVARDLRMPLRTVEDRRRAAMKRIGGRDITDLVRFVVKVETMLAMEGEFMKAETYPIYKIGILKSTDTQCADESQAIAAAHALADEEDETVTVFIKRGWNQQFRPLHMIQPSQGMVTL